MKYVRIAINWLMFLTVFIWMPVVYILIEVSLIRRMLTTDINKRCDTYKALFVGDQWFFTVSDAMSLRENGYYD